MSGREKPLKVKSEVSAVLDWLKINAEGVRVLEADDKQQNENVLAKDLTEFSQGKPTDFIIWNCLTFYEWEKIFLEKVRLAK